MTPNTAHPLPTPSNLISLLSADEQRLALLGLYDFEGRWDTLEAATIMVVDGEAKAALVRERLMPLADQLPALVADDVAAHQLWIARHWFDTQFCQAAATTEQPERRARAKSKAEDRTRRAQQGDK